MTANANLKLGVSLHSFTSEYITYKWSMEDLFELTSVLGGGLEIVGPAHQRGYPYLTDEYERLFKSSVERWGLTPTSYGTYADPFMLKDRDLSPDELVDYIVPQLKSAARLGFTIARLQYFSYTVIERLLPWAEKLNLKLGYELHVPLMIKSDRTKGLIEQIQRINSPYLGLIPDTGIFAHSIPEFRLNATRAAGVSEGLVQKAIQLWNAKTPDHVALETLLSLGLPKERIANIEMIWGSFGWSEPDELKEIFPYIIHIHGKFFSMKDGLEPNVRFEEVVKVLVENGYDGWISSEYEGQGGVDTFALVREQQGMIRRFQQKYAAQDLRA